jgi:large subunit ribosomal protein L31
MKTDIHPAYYPKAKVTCACGNSFTVGATREVLEVEVCSSCHPFYTGKDKVVDKMGQIQKFKERLAQKAAPKPQKVKASSKPKAPRAARAKKA